MQNLIIKYVLKYLLTLGGGALVTHGVVTNTQWTQFTGVGLTIAMAVFHWYEDHKAAVTAGKVPAPALSPKQVTAGITAALLAILAFPALLVGCSTITQHGYVFAETTRTLGIHMVTTTTTTGTPEVDLGWASQTLYFLPTATNGTTFTSPSVAANFGAANSASTLSTEITESFASGNYGIGQGSNNWGSVPTLPK